MISFMETKMTDLSVVAACTLGSSHQGTGLSGFGRVSADAAARPAFLASLQVNEVNERPTQAPAVVAIQAAAPTAAVAAPNGAGSPKQYRKQQEKWAFRGLEPWRDPA
ncbi:hypothetical protein [Streptomyces sp. NPDC003077]|uniref:hypothetical protein n=1 Tax=Streptomyces sp. NPDC003077 TaxID=3154443 RepID=UPI00339E7544